MHLTQDPTLPAVHAQVDSASDCYIAAVGFLREDSIVSTGLQVSRVPRPWAGVALVGRCNGAAAGGRRDATSRARWTAACRFPGCERDSAAHSIPKLVTTGSPVTTLAASQLCGMCGACVSLAGRSFPRKCEQHGAVSPAAFASESPESQVCLIES